MNCTHFQKQLTAYIEGTIDRSLADEMAAHEAECSFCARDALAIRTVLAALDTTEPVTAPRGFADRLRTRIEEETMVMPFSVTETPVTSYSPLSCEEFDNRIAAFVDGELSGDELRDMVGHRATCAACDRIASAHETVVMALETTPVIPAPSGFADRVRAAVAAEHATAPQKTRVLRFRPLDLLVAALVLVSTSAGAFLLVTSASSSNGLMTVLETLLIPLTAFPQIVMAWIAGTISPEQWIVISRILAPIEIPYLPLQLPAFVYACGALTTIVGTSVALKLVNNSVPYSLYNN
jgi:anti-sigma factor RsiW